MVSNATFVSALLALGVTQANYKPYPSVSNTSTSTTRTISTVDDTDVQPDGLVLPQNVRITAVMDASDPQCQVEPYDAPSVDHQEYPSYDEKLATVFRYRKQQSVNLGSWFVHENWMTPSLFRCAAGNAGSEIDIAYGWGNTTGARTVLERHWDTFINASDFKWLADVGINTVRLPIGYWNLGSDFVKGTDYESAAEVYQNSWARVKRAVNLAGEHGLGVLVDLHGVPGSQNGKDHSGVSNGASNLFGDSANMDKTIDILTFLTKEFVHVNNVVGIQVLNEPIFDDRLTDFYGRAMDAMRAADPDASRLPLYAHNGFDLKRFGPFVTGRKDFVVQDHHSYFVFSPEDRDQTATDHANSISNDVASTLGNASQETRGELIVGEWSCALPPESLASDSNQNQAHKDFCGGQVDTYGNNTAGWSFWSYTKEECDNDPGWCFKSAVGTVLPTKFFSYHHQQPESIQNSVAGSNHSFLLHDAELPLTRRDEFTRLSIPERFKTIARRRRRDGNTDADGKGYDDGRATAGIFAAHNMSRLGFVNQYISDTIANLGSNVIPQESEAPFILLWEYFARPTKMRFGGVL
ncbi:cytoplasm protein [Coprinopsis cinerea okayama7|uniref:Cytoplasm protein n=1 Tax=Coprinopsis cinerea (strain Okayama-7 / 130 / ATCC MYA-4618 / FGSC 9003) TaxID=240176 RepID=A8NHA6_COPC7|nr:cytoplasm protein [Coprinopsis cinerea okayama7\|eukprot:XP_001833722.2 cytoplasm protein [Coprinopsis cinerea okayama7\